MNFKDSTIIKTYHSYDGPLIYSAQVENEVFLAYCWNSRSEYMFFKTSLQDLQSLEENKVSLRDFFRKSPEIYQVDFQGGNTVGTKVSTQDMEKDAYVKENVFLEPEEAL